MLDYNQCKIIQDQLSKESASEFVKTIILSYCKTVSEAAELLELIPKIANKALKEKQEKINQYSWATNLLLMERCIYPLPERKKSKKSYNPDFTTLLYVSKAHFPNGNCEGYSEAGKIFWIEFVNCIAEKQGFDYEDINDWKFIKNTADCEEWFLNVIHQNIDKDFVPPNRN